MTINEKKLWRKWSRLINANRFDEADGVQKELDAIFDTENPGAFERRENWQAAQVESDARAIACGFTDGDESEVNHRPID